MGIFGPSASEKAAEEKTKAKEWGKGIKRSKCLGISTYREGNTVGGYGAYTVHTQGTFALEYTNGSIGSVTADIDSPYYLECVKKLEW